MHQLELKWMVCSTCKVFTPKAASSFFTVTCDFEELNLRATIHLQLQSESHPSTVVNSATINSNVSLIHQHNSGNSAPSQTYSSGTSVADLTTIAKYFWRNHI
jgi:hypothetical protein